MRAAWVGLPTTLGVLTLARRFARSELVTRGRDLSPGPFDMIHIFTMSQGVLEAELPEARKRLAPGGAVWVSWPALGANLPSDLTEREVRILAGECALDPAAPCQLTERWLALRLALPQSPI
ncbi:MAG: hypothetical protein AUK37_02145 [Rhodobacterales bacterium CG2_30_65_12]|nr:MAG: hypothetical protein AUK37_02145 [Rhodobacterales bacterium CG2_30_65_12]